MNEFEVEDEKDAVMSEQQTADQRLKVNEVLAEFYEAVGGKVCIRIAEYPDDETIRREVSLLKYEAVALRDWLNKVLP